MARQLPPEDEQKSQVIDWSSFWNPEVNSFFFFIRGRLPVEEVEPELEEVKKKPTGHIRW